MSNRLVVILGLSVMGVTLPLLGADARQEKGPKQSFEVTGTQRLDFPSGGTVRLNNSYGYLTVEGWDEPTVEITMTKSTNRFDEPAHKEKVERRFEDVRMLAERRSDKELAISTVLPVRRSPFTSVLPSGRTIVTPPLLPETKRGVTVEYRVRLPRDSRLIVHHDNGYVWVSDVTGDIEVNSRTGDMIVMLSDPGPYSIDARTRLGGITSDLMGKGRRQFLVGTHFSHSSEGPARRIYLRMGRGSITIKNGPSSLPGMPHTPPAPNADGF